MRITLAQLEAFVWVARLGKVGDAAGQLNIAQPTVSLRLRDLERALGAKVFERDGRRLQLTEDGTALLEHANVILNEVGKIRTPRDPADVAGTIRLGVSENFAVTGLPGALQAIARDHPALRVELSVGPSRDLVAAVLERRLDLAVAVNPAADARIKIVPLGVQPSTWAASPSLGLPRVIHPRDVHHLTVLMNPGPSPNHRQTMAWFAAAGLEPIHISSCNTVPGVLANLVEAGIGISILPTLLIAPQLKAGTLVALQCRPALEPAYLCIVRRADDALPSADAVLGAIRGSIAASGVLDFSDHA